MHLSQCNHPPQSYSPEGDYDYENDHHEILPYSQKALGQSPGNAQQHNFAPPASYWSGHLPLSPPAPHSILSPLLLPTQPISSTTYAASFGNCHPRCRDVSLQDSSMVHARAGRNPIYLWKHFAEYRAKVTQKESENEAPKWPLYLEDAFLDALLLIPFMGRKKISSKGQLYGRNMLITEYLWLCHWLLFPPQPGERIPVGKAREGKPGGLKPHSAFRGRKQVSSHIQVLKGFFTSHPCFHFFFPRKNDDKEEGRRHVEEEEAETESFKNNTVLIALAEGRLPDERPNYDYFARLLVADSDVFVRPKTCWLYVSSSKVTLSPDCREAYAHDGTILHADAYTSEGQRLECKGDYPHLVLNSNKEIRRDLRSGGDGEFAKYLLHEYTRTLEQKESSSMRDISYKWDHEFPELRNNLLSALDETHPSHYQTSRCVVGPCDTFKFDVVLDLHATSRFPSGSHLEGSVQLQICRPELANHRWRSITSVSKPYELENESEVRFWNCSSACNLVGHQKDVIEVPFPAKAWTSTFMALSEYFNADQGGKNLSSKIKKVNGSYVEGCEEKQHINKVSEKSYIPSELLKQVAMYQEIWSAPDDGSDELSSWIRRSIILWTFDHARTMTDDRGKTSTLSSGTSWRFLTKIDPISQAHQQRAYTRGLPNASSDITMTSMSTYTNHPSISSMHKNFSSETSDTVYYTLSQSDCSCSSTLGTVDDVNLNGLATPPPTSSRSSSSAHSLDRGTISSTDSLRHQIRFVPDGSDANSHGTLVAADEYDDVDSLLTSLDDPVLTGSRHDNDATLQAWTSTSTDNFGGFNQWDITHAANNQHNLVWANATGHLLADQIVPRDMAHWRGGKDSLWTTTVDSIQTQTSATRQDQNDVWDSAKLQAWLPSGGATAEASIFQHEPSPWNYHDFYSQRHQLPQQQNTSEMLNASVKPSSCQRDSVDSVPGLLHYNHDRVESNNIKSRKRARSESRETEEDRKGLPRASVRKLMHQDDNDNSNAGGAPVATMLESGGEHGLFF